ncbi:hypothetical protein CGC21_9455 [Leishmania donovani]|uniref:Uncharacterized protein n=1 Tax=Leishmania donovani TaxID=5661 RepID=A0A504X797_LEIDO|nr:hypothetical protein CGC21_9455 [Leishmania donovani]
MSSTWLHALRAYATRTNATPASLVARCRLFDQLCAVQLRGLPSAQLHPDALPVLREARWSLLREGTTADKAELLEHIVRQYAQASEKAMYAAPTASCSPDGISGSADAQRKQPGKKSSRTRSLQDRPPQHATRSCNSGSLLSDVQLSEMSVLQQLLLEQVQCLVEAKVSDIPLSARHYRYPMRSPLLATEALALCGDDGSAFRAVMHRVAPLRRDGWRCAWALADAAPLSRVLDDATAAAGGTASLDWLRGVLEAVDMRHRAAVGARQVSDSANAERNHVFEWVDRLRRLIVLRWRDAVGAVLELAAATDAAPAAAQAAGEGNCCADAVTTGRLMSILKAAEQPWMVLLFFYGDPLALQVASSGSRNDSNTKRPDSDAPARWQVSDKSVQAKVEECVRAARDADRLTVATGTILSERDKRHAAIYNHAMVALAATGHHTEAMHFYRTLPVLLVNCYTHWSVLQLFLQPTRDSRAASALRTSENYNHCARALRHLIRMSTAESEAAHAHTQVNGNSSGVHPATPIRCTRNQGGVWESMILWAALRRDAETVDLCATHAPVVSRYAHLIALLSAAASRSDGWSAAQAQVRHMCAAPRTTLKELSLATAVMASFFPRWPAGTAAAELPVRAELFDEVAHSMAPLVGRSQSRMDEMLQLLVGYSVSLRRRRRMPMTPQDEAAALDGILVKENILASTMDLARPRAGYASDVDSARSCDNGAAGDPGAWRTVVHVMISVAERQGLSAARAAPALVSAGVPAEMAIDLLPM